MFKKKHMYVYLGFEPNHVTRNLLVKTLSKKNIFGGATKTLQCWSENTMIENNHIKFTGFSEVKKRLGLTFLRALQGNVNWFKRIQKIKPMSDDSKAVQHSTSP